MVTLFHQRRCAENCWKLLQAPLNASNFMQKFCFFLFFRKKINSFPVYFLFQHKSFFYKLCYAIGTTKASVMKYQAVWLIAVSTADKWNNQYPWQPLTWNCSFESANVRQDPICNRSNYWIYSIDICSILHEKQHAETIIIHNKNLWPLSLKLMLTDASN